MSVLASACAFCCLRVLDRLRSQRQREEKHWEKQWKDTKMSNDYRPAPRNAIDRDKAELKELQKLMYADHDTYVSNDVQRRIEQLNIRSLRQRRY